jgi:hypothetical protein
MVWNLQVWVLRRHWAGLGVLDRPWRSFGQGAQQGLLHHSPTALHTVIPFLPGSQCQSATGWPHRHSQPGRASDTALQQASVALLSRLSHSTRPSYQTSRLQYGRLVVQYEVNSSTLAACVQYSTVQSSKRHAQCALAVQRCATRLQMELLPLDSPLCSVPSMEAIASFLT